MSLGVVSLFTNTPIDQSLNIVRQLLTKNWGLKDRTNLSVDDIVELCNLILTITYFLFDGQIYRQKFGAAMDSSVSTIIANLFMEQIEETVFCTATPYINSRLCNRYLDDVLDDGNGKRQFYPMSEHTHHKGNLTVVSSS